MTFTLSSNQFNLFNQATNDCCLKNILPIPHFPNCSSKEQCRHFVTINCLFVLKSLKFEVKNLNFEVLNLKFEVKSLDFEVLNLIVEVKSLEFEVPNLKFEVKSLNFEVLNLIVDAPNFKFEVKSLDFEVLNLKKGGVQKNGAIVTVHKKSSTFIKLRIFSKLKKPCLFGFGRFACTFPAKTCFQIFINWLGCRHPSMGCFFHRSVEQQS